MNVHVSHMRAGILFLTMLLLAVTFSGLVLGKNTPPVAKAGSDQKVKVGTLVHFGASDSYDSDGDTLNYRWDFDATDGIQVDSMMIGPTHTYDKPGVYKVTLTVNDGTYNSTAKINVTVVVDSPPIVELGPDIDAEVGQWLFFDTRNVTDPDGDGLTFKWDLDTSDNITEDSTDRLVQWKYPNPGKFTVRLTANDGTLGASDTMNVTVMFRMFMINGSTFKEIRPLKGLQRMFYLIPLTKGKGLEVKISSNDGKLLSTYLFLSANYIKFTQMGQIEALKGASKENFASYSYSIKAPQVDNYYLMVLNPSPDPNHVLNYTISIRIFNANSGGFIPGPGAIDMISSMLLMALVVVLGRRKN